MGADAKSVARACARVRAEELRLALVERYRDLGYALLAESARLKATGIDVLASQPEPPVRRMSAHTRGAEDALDEALAAL